MAGLRATLHDLRGHTIGLVDKSEKKRRKSLRDVFKRPETPPATPSLPSSLHSPVDTRTDLQSASPNPSDHSSPRIRPRTLQKANRTSIFGSLRSLHSLDDEERTRLTRSDSKASSMNEDAVLPIKGLFGDTVLQHGDVTGQGSTMFRKKSYYVVLTDSHLIRFKNQSKAAEVFPILSPALVKSPTPSRSSTTSFAELQMSTYNDITHGLQLDQVISVYALEDGRTATCVEISTLDERAGSGAIMKLQFNEATEAASWLAAIRTAVAEVRLRSDKPFMAKTVDGVARVLERENDYDPLHFRVFKAVQLTPHESSRQSSIDESFKHSSVVSYLAIGVNKFHILPLPVPSSRSSSASPSDHDHSSSVGLVNLTHVKLRQQGERLEVVFRKPLGQPQSLIFVSAQAGDIALWLRFACEYIRPEWITQPFVFDVPLELDEQMNPPNLPTEDYNSFDRTLIAHCTGFGVSASNIVYSVDHACEDAPAFRLMPPTTSQAYAFYELLAVFRSLRYNEYFATISFAQIDLRVLRDAFDPLENVSDCIESRSGARIEAAASMGLPVLSQEVRALALKSRKLRRLDFSHAVSRPTGLQSPSDSCGIPEALGLLSKRSLTNVDWIILTGIQLGENDVEHLVDTASERRCHIRALEVGDCGLSVHDIDVILSALAVHEHTMEVIDISGTQGRFSPELFQRQIGCFGHIRRLNLSRIQKTGGPEPLVSPDIILGWRLESLDVSQTSLNEQTIRTLLVYLASPKSDTLKELKLHQCGLTGSDLASLLRAMTRADGLARKMYVNASENRLGVGSSELAQSIASNCGPVSLNLRMMDFDKEHHFRELVEALTHNSTLRSLDISRASLPYDASNETCEALRKMLATNETLEELDISGEHTHLDAARFGIGLNIALRGLEANTTLQVLKIEHQSLGLQGASTLAAVMEANTSLLDIHCDHNDINLQSFTVLVNALKNNRHILYLPTLDSDKAKSLEKVRDEFAQSDRGEEDKHRSSPKTAALKRGFNTLSAHIPTRTSQSHHRRTSSSVSNVSFTEQDVTAAMSALEERWQRQLQRMQTYLLRNYQYASGHIVGNVDYRTRDLDEGDGYNDSRPATSDSIGRILGQVKLDRTPTVEKPGLLDAFDEKPSGEQRSRVFSLPDD